MMRVGLLDVLLTHFIDGSDLDEVEEDQHMTMSVLGNLTRLLNTRQGSLEQVPDFGLPDLSTVYRDMPDSVERLRQAVQKAVETYEPRLAQLSVRKAQRRSRDGKVVFVLQGEVAGRRVRLQTAFGSGDPVIVREWDPSIDA